MLGALQLLFVNTTFTGYGDATGLVGSSTVGNLYFSLHNGDPASGSQSSSEISYTGYARAAVPRTSSYWTVALQLSGDYYAEARLIQSVDFPTCTGGSASAIYLGIGTDSTGSGKLLYSCSLSPTLSIASGVTPRVWKFDTTYSTTCGRIQQK